MFSGHKRSSTGWAISHWYRGIYVDTVRQLRRDAIASFMEGYDTGGESWAEISRHGAHQAVKVVILPVASPSPGANAGGRGE